MKSDLEIEMEGSLENKFFRTSFFDFTENTKKFIFKQLKDWYLPLFVSSRYFPKISTKQNFIVDKIVWNFIKYLYKSEKKLIKDFHSNIEFLGDIHPNGLIKTKIGNKIVFPAKFDCESFIPELLKILDPKFSEYFVKFECYNNLFVRDFISASNDFENINDIEKYYFNFGRIIPFLLFFRTIDQHIENVICNKQYPLFFDIETCAVPEIIDEKYSIFYTGLITESKDINIGSLNGESEKIKSYFVPILKFDNTNPKINWVSISKNHYFNRPKLQNKRIQIKDFLAMLISGFETGSKQLQLNKDNLLTEIKKSKSYTRIILRPTSIYFILQQKIFFPHIFLQESFSIEKFFRQELLQNKIYLNCSLDMEGLLKYEVNSLLHGQIPVFYMKINDNLIYDAYGKILGKTEKNPSDYILNQSINLDSFLAENLENIKVFF